jgi:hypothetical protein
LEKNWILKFLEFHIFKGINVFSICLIGFYPLNFFLIKCVLLYKSFSNPLQCHRCSLLEVLNQNLNLKFHQMGFWFEFLGICMNDKVIICHGFKWQNITIYLIFCFFCSLMLILACWIMVAFESWRYIEPCHFTLF